MLKKSRKVKVNKPTKHSAVLSYLPADKPHRGLTVLNAYALRLRPFESCREPRHVYAVRNEVCAGPCDYACWPRQPGVSHPVGPASWGSRLSSKLPSVYRSALSSTSPTYPPQHAASLGGFFPPLLSRTAHVCWTSPYPDFRSESL